MCNVYLKKNNNIISFGMWSTKKPEYAQILALVGLSHNIVGESKKSLDKSNRNNRETSSSTEA